MHAPYVLSADDLDDFSGIYRKPSILAADDFLGACYREAMTPPQKLWTLLFLQKSANASPQKFQRESKVRKFSMGSVQTGSE